MREVTALSSDQSASKHFLKSHLAYGRRFITATTLATCGVTVAIILQAFAFARSMQLVVIERAGLSSLAPWLLVFAAGSILRSVLRLLRAALARRRCAAHSATAAPQRP